MRKLVCMHPENAEVAFEVRGKKFTVCNAVACGPMCCDEDGNERQITGAVEKAYVEALARL